MARKRLSHDDLLREALADAKTVKELALETAKTSLKESFAPRVKRMISTRLAEEEEEELDGLDEEGDEETPDDIEDIDFGGDESGEEPVEEEEDFEIPDEEDEEPIGEEDEFDMEEEPVEEEEDFGGDEFSDDEEEMPVEEDDDIDLGGEEEEEDADFTEALRNTLAELEDEMGGEEDEEELPVEEGEEEEEADLEEEADSSDIGTGDNKQPSRASSDDSTPDPGKGDLYEEEGEEEGDEDISIDEILNLMREFDEVGDAPESDEEPEDATPVAEQYKRKARNYAKKLKESYKAIQYLRNELNEVNLLNAKLMFANKLFANYELSESAKVKVIENFDLAKNLREVKLVFANAAQFLEYSKKKSGSRKSSSIREGASRQLNSTRPSKQKILDEGASFKKRMQELANINRRK